MNILKHIRRLAGIDSPGGSRFFPLSLVTVLVLLLRSHAPVDAKGPAPAPNMLPDLITIERWLGNWCVVDDPFSGKTHLRLDNGVANVGLGKLYLHSPNASPGADTALVLQRVFREDDTFWDRPAGYFTYHPGHSHIHYEEWAIYRLRFAPGGGLGDPFREGDKTTFCIADALVHDSSLPGFNPVPQFYLCNTDSQGLGVGWADVYYKHMDGQCIDITGVPDGTYWLESETDPNNNVLESDETNNIARILITIGNPDSTTIGVEPPETGPFPNVVRGAYPNPTLTGATSIAFMVEKTTQVTVQVFDSSGRVVHEARVGAVRGTNTYRWNGKTTTVTKGVKKTRNTKTGKTTVKKGVKKTTKTKGGKKTTVKKAKVTKKKR